MCKRILLAFINSLVDLFFYCSEEAFIQTADRIYQKIQRGEFDVSNETYG